VRYCRSGFVLCALKTERGGIEWFGGRRDKVELVSGSGGSREGAALSAHLGKSFRRSKKVRMDGFFRVGNLD